jgi:hypothetical protein
VQLEVRMATGDDHRLAELEQVSPETHVLMVWFDEPVKQTVAADRHVLDRYIIDDNVRVAVGLRQEPIVELLPGACFVGRYVIQRCDEGP